MARMKATIVSSPNKIANFIVIMGDGELSSGVNFLAASVIKVSTALIGDDLDGKEVHERSIVCVERCFNERGPVPDLAASAKASKILMRPPTVIEYDAATPTRRERLFLFHPPSLISAAMMDWSRGVNSGSLLF